MKKILKLVVLVLLTFTYINVYAEEEVTIDKIIEAFNTGSTAETYQSAGGSVKATYDSDSIDIVVKAGGTESNVSLDFDGKIISVTLDSANDTWFTSGYMYLAIADEIGQLYGYEEGELSQTLNSDLVDEYTLENEGFEIEKVSDTVSIMRIDITKKVPLVDLSSIYLEVSDIESSKEYISGDGSFSGNKANIYYNKQGYDGDFTVVIGEKGALSESAYKSLLSIIEVMFEDENITNYFKTNLPDLSTDKAFGGIEVKVDSTKFTEEDIEELPLEYESSGYQFIIVYIDKEEVIASAGTKQPTETTPTVEEEETPTTQEDTQVVEEKEDDKPFNFVTIGIVAVVVVGVVVVLLVTKKKKNGANSTANVVNTNTVNPVPGQAIPQQNVVNQPVTQQPTAMNPTVTNTTPVVNQVPVPQTPVSSTPVVNNPTPTVQTTVPVAPTVQPMQTVQPTPAVNNVVTQPVTNPAPTQPVANTVPTATPNTTPTVPTVNRVIPGNGTTTPTPNSVSNVDNSTGINNQNS